MVTKADVSRIVYCRHRWCTAAAPLVIVEGLDEHERKRAYADSK